MRSVIVVDDQDAVRQRAAEIVEGMDLGLGPVYQASDGEAALRLIEEKKPGIALVDIVMPNMDGFELIRRIRESGYPTHIIVISSYDDFDYTKRAITLKVDDYILKPLQVKELYGVLLSVTERMDREDEDAVRRREKELDYHRMVLYEFMTGADVFTGMDRILESIAAVPLPMPFFSVLAMGMQSHSLGEIRSIMSALEGLLAGEGVRWLVVNEDKQDVFYILNHTENGRQFVQGLKAFLSRPGLHLNAGLSDGLAGFESLREAYRQSCFAMREALFGRLSFCGYASVRDRPRNFVAVGDIERLVELIRQEKREEFEKHLNGIFTSMTRDRWNARDVESALSDILNYLCINLKNLFPRIRELDLQGFSAYRNDIFKMKMTVRDTIGKISDIVWGSGRPESNNLSVDWIVRHIHANFHKDISLAYLANELNLNYYYVSGLFTKKTGMPFSEYLMKVRIDKAKELLAGTSDKIADIAVSAGFKDPQYFCKAFKRLTLMTPVQYRERKSMRSGY